MDVMSVHGRIVVSANENDHESSDFPEAKEQVCIIKKVAANNKAFMIFGSKASQQTRSRYGFYTL